MVDPQTSSLSHKILIPGQATPNTNQEWMIVMRLIPCANECVYQTDGLCALNSAAAAGLPALGGACIHFTPVDAARLGSPHRYYEPGSNAVPGAREGSRPDAPGSDTV